MKVLLDTNILLRLGQVGNPHRPVTLAATEALDAAGHTLCVVQQVLYEFWVVATPPVLVNGLGMDAAAAEESLDELTRQVTLLRDERGVYGHWRSLILSHQVLGKSAHDARLVAAMLRHGVSHILNFNTADFARYGGITPLAPDAIVAGQLPA